MNDYVDLHTHTIASGHAYSTIEAMIKAAEQKGIRLFGITEHAPKCREPAASYILIIFACWKESMEKCIRCLAQNLISWIWKGMWICRSVP